MSAKGFLQEYEVKKLKDKSKNTVDAYLSDLRQFFTFFKKDLEELTTDDIEAYKSHLLGKKLKPKTVNRKLVSIRQYIEYINTTFEHKIFVEIKLIKIQRQEYLEELLTKADFDRLVKAAETANDKRAVAVFYGLYLTGARVSELLQFKVCDICNDTLVIKGEGSKYRNLFIPDRLRQYISDYLKEREAAVSDYVFTNKVNNEPMDRQSVHNLIKKYAGIAKVKLTKAHAHNFRHMYCFRLIEEGLNLDEVADLAGHTDINTTRIYTRKTKTELMRAIKGL